MADKPRRTILVVDDDAAFRQLCRLHLEEAGFGVIEAGDGDEALELVAKSPPDAILLDVLMPRLSGWKVAGDPVTDGIPIIFLSVLTQRQERLRGLRLGAVGYLPKPFDPTTLGETIAALFDEIERGERSGVVAETIEKLQAELERDKQDVRPAEERSR